MPLYEEKLICPLAVRFTQEHIRPQFKDGRKLDESIREVQINSGEHGYDFILEAPFPSIEIIRWSQFDTETAQADGDHWFTLDNRRLYCLQHVAASLWPKKCAVRVEVLYAACHGIKRKDTSRTVGRDVAIKHSDRHTDQDQSDHWDWRAAVQVGLDTCLRRALRGITEDEIRNAYGFVASEDKKASTQELLDAPEAPSLLSKAKMEPAVANGDASTDGDCSSAERASTPSSTRSTLRLEDAVPCKDTLTQYQPSLSALQVTLKGIWAGRKDETYEVLESGKEDTWTCMRRDAQGFSKRFTVWFDAQSNCISWGLDWNYYADASEFLKNPSTIQWYSGHARTKKPLFKWHHTMHLASSTR
eukprot:TRINITY_DN130_c0_g2_i2.p1 TRINITY_DN130_c0_g2~~TRINITY_DN130_c0_g2_i2.p1  ORF type:complete len:360 (-),score=61.32 TRINITY_DN130_c0_g2_i2:345-1424(-)